MQRKAAKILAERLVAEHGAAAYEKAVAAERVAGRKQDKRLAKFLAEVARQIGKQTARAKETVSSPPAALPL
jgi:hypothetical protein